ncbi:MAG TPA: type II secretion system F family protein [Candidatus Paceibacterota bacterium]|nr:type II secretion system F family protein [Candidatus Paceibacterota bacterium]
MSKFEFKARKASGEIVEGIREGSDRFQLSRELVSEGFIPVSIKPAQTKVKYDFAFFNELFVRIKLHEKIMFARNLSSMLSAGLSLSRALSVLHKQTDNVKLKRILKSILEDVESGRSLSQATSKFPNVFSSLFVAMIAAGEESGSLPASLKIVSEQLDKVYVIRKKVSGAMVYPAIIFVAMIIIGALMLVYVVPNLTKSFAEFGAKLPYSTQLVVNSSNFLLNHYLAAIMLLALLSSLIYYGFNSKRGQRTVDYIFLRLPVVSSVVKQINSASAARTISSLVSSGVTIVKSLEITTEVVQNYYYKEALTHAAEKIQKGGSMSDFFKEEEKLFPILMGEMAEVGEETGNLPAMLMNVAVFYEGEVDALTKDMSTIIEPVLMLFIGLAVGFFAISMVQPIYALSGNV